MRCYSLCFFFYFTQYNATIGTEKVSIKDVLFKPFHSLITSCVDSIVESFLHRDNRLCTNNSYMSAWCKCMFTGEESFNEVSNKLYKDIFDVESYVLFVSYIPFMKYLFQAFGSLSCPGHLLVNFFTSVQSFRKFNHEVYVFVDEQESLCGLTPDRIQCCYRCLDNSKFVESYKFHDFDCPYFRDLFPDLVCNDVDRILNSYVCDIVMQQCTFLQSPMVEEMYRAAIVNAMKPNYGVRIIPLLDSTDQ